MKEKSEKVGLRLNIQKTKIMASGLITSWQIDGETVSDFIFGGSKITADSDCSHEIKRCLLLLDSIKQDQRLTVAQIMKSVLPNSDLNWRKEEKPLDHSGMTYIKSRMIMQCKWEINLRD